MQTVQVALWVVLLLVALALAFDFMNGFHDAAKIGRASCRERVCQYV